MNDLKACAQCKVLFPRSRFGQRKARSGNIVPRSYCRACERKKSKERYDPQKARQHYEYVKQNDPERLKRYGATRRAKNPEKHKDAARQWREKNKERVAEYARAYKQQNRAAATAWERGRHARKKSAELLPFSKDQLMARLSMFPGCWMCGGPKETVDHVKPLSKGGAHALANMRPACRSCNSRKRNKWPLTSLQLRL